MRTSALVCCLVALPFLSRGVSVAGDKPAVHPLVGKSLLSLKKLPCGEKPDGTVTLGHWRITFEDEDSFEWQHHDVIALGRYAFDARSGLLTVEGGAAKIEASFDAKSAVLTWNNVEYKVMKADDGAEESSLHGS